MAEVVQTCAELDWLLGGHRASVSAPPSAAIRAASPRSTYRGRRLRYEQAQTGAMGTYDYLVAHVRTAAAAGKVINVPGCPTNPWWFILTVVCFLVDFNNLVRNGGDQGPLGILERDVAGTPSSTSARRGLDAPPQGYVYRHADPRSVLPALQRLRRRHLRREARRSWLPAEARLQGPRHKSLCGMHGWNGQQPQNRRRWDYGVARCQPERRRRHPWRSLHARRSPLHGLH